MPHKVWTDGACKGNPGPAGWAYIVRNPKGEIAWHNSGHIRQGTNNVAELMACIEALASFEDNEEVIVFTDSMYVIKGITMWVKGWKRRGWINSRQEPVANRKLWEKLLVQDKRLDVTWRHVKGHNGQQENEWCDKEAVSRCLR